MERFTLDEAKATGWLADRDGIAGYWPVMSDDGTDTFLLIEEALEAGVIADTAPLPNGCNSFLFEYIPDGDGDGYRWVMYHDPGGSLITSSRIHQMSHLGDGYDSKGTSAGLAVLREAVREGNRLAGQVSGYVASLPLAVRAPEIGQLAAQLPAGEWGADELGTLANWLTALGFQPSPYALDGIDADDDGQCPCCMAGNFSTEAAPVTPATECKACGHLAAFH